MPPLGVQNFTASGEAEARRCARREELLARGCPEQELEEPRGHQEVLQDRPLSQGDRGEGATQLAPQRIRVTLRPGDTGCTGCKSVLASNALGCRIEPPLLYQGSPRNSGSASSELRGIPWTCTTLWT